MSDNAASGAETPGAVVAELAAAATETAAEAAAAVEHIEQQTAEAVAEVAEELEDEVSWLKNELADHKTTLAGISETLVNLPASLSEALRSSLREILAELKPPPKESSESPAPTPESLEAPAPEAEKSGEPRKSGIRYL